MRKGDARKEKEGSIHLEILKEENDAKNNIRSYSAEYLSHSTSASPPL